MIYKRFTRVKGGRFSWAGRRNLKSRSTEWIRRIYYTIITLPLHALISNRNFTKVQALGSGHADQGLSEYNPTST